MKDSPASRRLAALTAACFVLVSCSKQPQAPAATAPLVTTEAGAAPVAADIFKGEVAAHGIPTQYDASFVDNQLTKIAETRKTGAATQTGDYEFYGARLTRYSGAALQGGTPIELEFDLRGAVTKSRAGSGEVPAEEITAIRERAQLLRNHALAARSVRAHGNP